MRNGYRPGRSGDVQLVPDQPNYLGAYRSHSGPWDYVQRVPLLFYGPGRVEASGVVRGPATVADVAPTLADHLNFVLPEVDGSTLPEGGAVNAAGRPPQVVVVVVWDGVGRNVLARYPDAWPTLRSLIPDGAWFDDAIVGSSPTITAAVHATIGTGAFPSTHGRVGNRVRLEGTMHAVEDVGPTDLLRPTLADQWDLANGNRARVALVAYRQWHLGLIGHGALLPGGDHDLAVLLDQEETGRWMLPAHERSAFRFPAYAGAVGGLEPAQRALDIADGQADGRWRDEDLGDPAVAWSSPAYSAWQTRLLRRILSREGFGDDGVTDLLFTNYKQGDLVSHRWGMESRRMRDVVRALDAELGELVTVLDSVVGRGEWVVALTADHGSTPPPAETGATVIDDLRLTAAIRSRFDSDGDSASTVQAISPTQVWLRRGELDDEGVTVGSVARFIAGYTAADNAKGGLPTARRDVRLFAGAFASRLLSRPRCAEP